MERGVTDVRVVPTHHQVLLEANSELKDQVEEQAKTNRSLQEVRALETCAPAARASSPMMHLLGRRDRLACCFQGG